MVGKDKVVMRSIEAPGNVLCVDLLRSETGDGWSWAEYRRDPEDGRGWQPTGAASSGYADEETAFESAEAALEWLRNLD